MNKSTILQQNFCKTYIYSQIKSLRQI